MPGYDSRTALVVVDVQNDFADPAGSLAVAGGPEVVDAVNAEVSAAIAVRGDVVRKGENGEDGYSGFTMKDPVTDRTVPTRLEALLRERGVERLVVVGLATDYCVRATALDGRRLGWPVTVPWVAVRAVDLEPGDGERTRDELLAAGVEVA